MKIKKFSLKKIYTDRSDNGITIDMSIGDELNVTLIELATAGYSWRLLPIKKDILIEVGLPITTLESKLIGSSGKTTFTLRAVKTGQTQLKFVNKRPWDKRVSSINIFELFILVK